MEHSNIGDSSIERSTQPAMSGNTRELATSLVEMKIASGDLPMPEAAASQGGDGQQLPRDRSVDAEGQLEVRKEAPLTGKVMLSRNRVTFHRGISR